MLCGCQRERIVSCSRFDGDDSLTLQIEAVNDDVVSIEVIELYQLPGGPLADATFSDDFARQLDDTCHLEEDRLIRRYEVFPDGTYSLQKTIEELRAGRFHCE